MKKNNKEIFIIPEALLIAFNSDDIIALSEYSTDETDGFFKDGDIEKW